MELGVVRRKSHHPQSFITGMWILTLELQANMIFNIFGARRTCRHGEKVLYAERHGASRHLYSSRRFGDILVGLREIHSWYFSDCLGHFEPDEQIS
jgi:hypothetical protein